MSDQHQEPGLEYTDIRTPDEVLRLAKVLQLRKLDIPEITLDPTREPSVCINLGEGKGRGLRWFNTVDAVLYLRGLLTTTELGNKVLNEVSNHLRVLVVGGLGGHISLVNNNVPECLYNFGAHVQTLIKNGTARNASTRPSSISSAHSYDVAYLWDSANDFNARQNTHPNDPRAQLSACVSIDDGGTMIVEVYMAPANRGSFPMSKRPGCTFKLTKADLKTIENVYAAYRDIVSEKVLARDDTALLCAQCCAITLAHYRKDGMYSRGTGGIQETEPSDWGNYQFDPHAVTFQHQLRTGNATYGNTTTTRTVTVARP